jgi:hypothetical protein
VRFKALLVVWCLLWIFALPVVAHSEPSAEPESASSSPPQFAPADQSNPTPPGQRPSPEDQERARIEKDMAKKINQERQAHLKRDTEQLLKLANELKQYVDKSNENILSLDVIKKAEEIEKLAHSVKEKMKASY